MIRSKTYLPLAAVAALGLGLYGCGGGGGPATMMPEPEPDPGAVADAIDFTANRDSTQDSSNWWNSFRLPDLLALTLPDGVPRTP